MFRFELIQYIDHIDVFVHHSTVIMKIETMPDLLTLMLYGKLILFFNRNFALSGKIINSKYQIVLYNPEPIYRYITDVCIFICR